MDFGFVDVNILHSGYQQVSAAHVTILKIMRTKTQI